MPHESAPQWGRVPSLLYRSNVWPQPWTVYPGGKGAKVGFCEGDCVRMDVKAKGSACVFRHLHSCSHASPCCPRHIVLRHTRVHTIAQELAPRSQPDGVQTPQSLHGGVLHHRANLQPSGHTPQPGLLPPSFPQPSFCPPTSPHSQCPEQRQRPTSLFKPMPPSLSRFPTTWKLPWSSQPKH